LCHGHGGIQSSGFRQSAVSVPTGCRAQSRSPAWFEFFHIPAGARVLHLNHNMAVCCRQLDLCLPGAGMFTDIGQKFVHFPVEGDIDSAMQIEYYQDHSHYNYEKVILP